jgi:dynein heavy chain
MNKYPIDRVEFKFEILKHIDLQRAHEEPPEIGCFLKGLYLEGASWNDLRSSICESKEGEIHVAMPIINFIPIFIE